MDIVYFILIGICAGFIAGKLTSGKGFGLVGNLVIGVIGAILGGFIIRLLGFSAQGLLASLITAVLGAIVLLFLLAKFVKK